MQIRQSTMWERRADLPWFLLKASSSLATVAGTRAVALPSDFIREYEEGELWLTDSDGYSNTVVKDLYARLRSRFTPDGGEQDSGKPDSYAIVGSSFYLFPLPDAVYPLDMFYYASAAPLTADIENVWTLYAADFVAADVGLLVARHLRDESGVRFFSDDLSMAEKRMFVDNEARKHAAFRAYMGG